MQNFQTFWLHDILTQQKILLPAGNAKVSFIATQDISAVAAKLLLSDAWNNQAFDLTGPESLDHAQVAKLISDASGKKIGYQEIEAEALHDGLTQAGLTQAYADFLIMILGFLKAGYAERTTDSVRSILGKGVVSFKAYAAENKQVWK